MIAENVVYGGIEAEISRFTAWMIRDGQVFIARADIPTFLNQLDGPKRQWVVETSYRRAIRALQLSLIAQTGAPAQFTPIGRAGA